MSGSTNTALQIKSANTAFTLTSLASLANSATSGWQSDEIILGPEVSDVIVGVKIPMAATAPASDKAVYIYACPWYYNGTTYLAASQGTATLPSGSPATTIIASPNDLKLLGALAYTTTGMTLQNTFLLSNCFGKTMPDAFSIILINFSGASLAASGQEINYKTVIFAG